MTKGCRTGRGDDDYKYYPPPQPDSEAAAALSNLGPEISFAFGGEEAVAIAVRYIELVFAVSAQGYLLFLVHFFR